MEVKVIFSNPLSLFLSEAVESLDNPIGDGVVCSCADSPRAKQGHQGIPQFGLRLPPPVCGDGRWDAESYDPSLDECWCYRFSAVMSCIGKASGHRVYCPMQVSMYA